MRTPEARGGRFYCPSACPPTGRWPHLHAAGAPSCALHLTTPQASPAPERPSTSGPGSRRPEPLPAAVAAASHRTPGPGPRTSARRLDPRPGAVRLLLTEPFDELREDPGVALHEAPFPGVARHGRSRTQPPGSPRESSGHRPDASPARRRAAQTHVTPPTSRQPPRRAPSARRDAGGRSSQLADSETRSPLALGDDAEEAGPRRPGRGDFRGGACAEGRGAESGRCCRP